MNTDAKQKRREQRYEKARSILEAGLDDIQEPGGLKDYLEFRAHFREYSFRNALLIREQLPGAQFCKGYRAWQEVGRQVQKGESGLLIFVPYVRKVRTEEEAEDKGKEIGEKALFGFGTGYVFDISQTAPIEDFDGEVLTYTSPIPELEGEGHAALYDDLKDVAELIGYEVDEYEAGAYRENGFCDPKGKIGVRIGPGRSPNGWAKTLAHEIVHAQAHMGREAREKKTAGERELQAEGAAFLFCYLVGLDTSEYSLPYMKSWEHTGEDLQAELTQIEGLAFDTLDLLDQIRS